MKQKESNETAWDLARVLRLLRHRGWIVVVSAIAAGALFLCAAALAIPTRYRAETLLHIHSAGEDGLSWSELTAAQGLVHTCVALLDSRTLLEEAEETAGLGLTWQELSAAVRGEPVDDTELLRVIAEGRDPQQAAAAANAVSEALARRVGELVAGSRVQVVDAAVEPRSPCAPDYPLAGAIGVIVGGGGSLLVLMAVEDRRKIPAAGREG